MSCVVRKPAFCIICENKDADQLCCNGEADQISFAVTAKLISAFVFVTRIVQSLFFLNPKYQSSRHILWPYSPVCVGPGQKRRRPVFSQRGSIFQNKQLTRTDCDEDGDYDVPYGCA